MSDESSHEFPALLHFGSAVFALGKSRLEIASVDHVTFLHGKSSHEFPAFQHFGSVGNFCVGQITASIFALAKSRLQLSRNLLLAAVLHDVNFAGLVLDFIIYLNHKYKISLIPCLVGQIFMKTYPSF